MNSSEKDRLRLLSDKLSRDLEAMQAKKHELKLNIENNKRELERKEERLAHL